MEVKSNYWKFSETPYIEEKTFNDILNRFFEYGISGLVRENIQNSLDAKIPDSSEPIKVVIKLGKIRRSYIPGYQEIKNRILALDPGNQYTKEAIDEMRHYLSENEMYYMSFEDINTKGLKGAQLGQTESSESSYSPYAYSKGIHFYEEDEEIEKLRGGSHGVGKIASNSASNLNTMFFSNCDENNYKTLGGTIQLIEHQFNSKYYRSTGYFTDIKNGTFYPYENDDYNEIYKKDTRGLKIIIPFLRVQFYDEKEVIRSVVSNFLLAIINNDLIVEVNENEINENTIKNYIYNEEYFEQNYEDIKNDFTRLYLDTIENHLFNSNFEIKDSQMNYYFKLYFQVDSNIKRGKLGVFRSIGMKIEDKTIPSNSRKPFNAVLIPNSAREDMFLKSLENESHTRLDANHIKNKNLRANASKFISNLEQEISKLIDEQLKDLYPNEEKLDTSDIIYELDNKFKRDLERDSKYVNYGKGDQNKKIIKIEDSEDLGTSSRNKKGKKRIQIEPKKVKKQFGTKNSKSYYKLASSSVKRINSDKFEKIIINISKLPLDIRVHRGNLLISLIDGMGKEYKNAIDLTKSINKIFDNTTKEELKFNQTTIRGIDITNDIIYIRLYKKGNVLDKYKFRFYLEV